MQLVTFLGSKVKCVAENMELERVWEQATLHLPSRSVPMPYSPGVTIPSSFILAGQEAEICDITMGLAPPPDPIP